MHIRTSTVVDRIKQPHELTTADLLDPSKAESALVDPEGSTFLQFVGLYYELLYQLHAQRSSVHLKALSMLPGGFSPKEQTAAHLLNKDHPGTIESMTSLDADYETLQRLRALFRNRLDTAFLDHLITGRAEDMPLLDDTFDVGIMNHGIDDILTSQALTYAPRDRFIYHPPPELERDHARICQRVGRIIRANLRPFSAHMVEIIAKAMQKLKAGGTITLTNYPSHHFAKYDAFPEGEGYFRDITHATDECLTDIVTWAYRESQAEIVPCTVEPFSLGFTFNEIPQTFTSENIVILQKT